LESEREYELAADYFGLQYVYVTDYDPESYISLLERVWSRIASTAPSVFSTSPPLADRVARMQKEIAKILPKRSGAIVSTPAFADFQERLRAWKSANVGQQR
jgi:predicted Zn-dependent protease